MFFEWIELGETSPKYPGDAGGTFNARATKDAICSRVIDPLTQNRTGVHPLVIPSRANATTESL